MRVLGALLVLLLIGVGLITVSATMPEYLDPARAEELLNVTMAPRTEPARQEFTDQWFADMAETRTQKWLFFDFGLGLILTALSVFCLISFTRSTALWDWLRPGSSNRPNLAQIYGVKGILKAQSPRARWRFLVYWTILHAGFFVFVVMILIIDEIRGYVPFWSNTEKLIYVLAALAGFSWPVLMGTWIVLLIPASLPTRLWVWNKTKLVWSCFWTLLHAVPAGAILLLLATSYTTQQVLIIPFLIFGLYLIESSRSAGLAPRRPTPL